MVKTSKPEGEGTPLIGHAQGWKVGDMNALHRFFAKVQIDDPNGCWLWTAFKDPLGYGRFQIFGLPQLSHRISYMAVRGPIPEGLELDHLCRNPPCCNPAHLEAVTRRENLLRSPITFSGINVVKTHCKRGHPLSGENLYVPPNNPTYRGCRSCRSEAMKRFYARRRRERSA